MRAYRPGHVGSDEFNKEFQGQRQEKIELYACRASNRLPLFGAPKQSGPPRNPMVEPDRSAEVS